MKEKISELQKKLVEFIDINLKPSLLKVDSKISTLIPNPKIKKIAYIGVGSLFGFMFLLILIGILISPFRKTASQNVSEPIKKTVIINATPEPKKELSATEKEIMTLGNEIKNLTYPESVLNLPNIEKDLSI